MCSAINDLIRLYLICTLQHWKSWIFIQNAWKLFQNISAYVIHTPLKAKILFSFTRISICEREANKISWCSPCYSSLSFLLYSFRSVFLRLDFSLKFGLAPFWYGFSLHLFSFFCFPNFEPIDIEWWSGPKLRTIWHNLVSWDLSFLSLKFLLMRYKNINNMALVQLCARCSFVAYKETEEW